MPIRLAAALAFAALLAAGTANAGDDGVRSLPAGAAPAPAELEDLKALTGDWAGPGASAGFSAPAVGEIVGHLLFYTDDGQRVQEMWVIRPDGASVLVRQKDYDTQLNSPQGKDQWAERRLVATSPGQIYFNNLTFITGPNSLDIVMRVAGKDGAPSTTLTYNLKRLR